MAIVTLALGAPDCEPKPSIFLTNSMPSTTSPKTTYKKNKFFKEDFIGEIIITCLPSSHDVTTVVIKNCEPFVFGPALAIDKRPGFECLSLKFSSANFSP